MAAFHPKTLDEEARLLVRLNQSELRTIVRSYIFPDRRGETIRVVHVDRHAIAEDQVQPIAFGPDRPSGLTRPMQIALVGEDAVGRLPLPEGWGDWSDATVVNRSQVRRAHLKAASNAAT